MSTEQPLTIELFTSKFCLSGPIRADANAGNQFYGEDLALWLREKLSPLKSEIIDEDWGWLLMVHPSEPEWTSNDLAIYAFPEEKSEGGADWEIVLHSSQTTKMLGLIPIRKQIPADPDFLERLLAVFRMEGIEARVVTQ